MTDTKLIAKALEYYAKELEWREVEQTMNFCDDDCPRDCNWHNTKYKTRARSVGHSMELARAALAEYRGEK